MQLDRGGRAGSTIWNYLFDIINSYKIVHDFYGRNHRELEEMNFGSSEACAFKIAGGACRISIKTCFCVTDVDCGRYSKKGD